MNTNYKNAKNLLLLVLFIILASKVLAQPNTADENIQVFYMDAVVFKSALDSLGRVDVFVIVPYQSLNFIKSSDIYGAKYSLVIKIEDMEGRLVDSKDLARPLYEKDYFRSQGGTGKFDYSQTTFNVPPGKYNVDVAFTDDYSKKTKEHTREVTIIDFRKYKFTLSGILFVSSIEEKDKGYVITPHISDNVGDIKDHFFMFFETYSKDSLDSIDFVYEIRNKEDDIKYKSTRFKFNIGQRVQNFIKVTFPPDLIKNTYKIRLIALKPNTKGDWKESDYLAVSERSIKYEISVSGIVLQDLDKAIKQLRYVAMSDQQDFIEKATTVEEKQRRFNDFWKALDPSPNTDRNEAFEEYYGRIEFANKNFRSISEGWQSDKGMVYIVYGRPMNIQKSNPYGDSRSYETWNYPNGKQFIFYDNSGFGDYRLYSPLTVTDKYKYER